MAGRVTSWLSRPSLLRALASHLGLTLRLLREPGVPVLIKAVPLLAAVYVISPLDLVPDLLPLLGQVDDLGVVLLTLGAFTRLCPAEAVEFHRAAIAQGRKYSPMPSSGKVIDAEFRRDEDAR
jgi:uncharacterized membrane protein YkvA (DUF1232 family)